jgi:hypothetical protein
VSEIQAVASEGFEMLTAVDRTASSSFELWFRTQAGTVIMMSLSYEQTAPSIATIFKVASWKEREIHEMFGVEFDDAISNQPLFNIANQPLRKNKLLKKRNTITWPGLKDPTDTSTSPSRRKSLPLGVSDEKSELI